MARVSIYIPDALYFRLLKKQKADKCSFSFLCATAFAKFLEDSGSPRNSQVTLKPVDAENENA